MRGKVRMFFSFISFSIGFGVFMLLAYGILQWLHIPAGNLVDWLIGIASFWWLLVVVTVPWNIYFDAQEVVAEAGISRDKKIVFDDKQLNYVSKVSRWSIIVAIALHILSAIGLYSLAATGISQVGYVSSGATLLLTALRPAIRAYQYIAVRLSMIRQQIKYPREDVIELRDRVNTLESTIKKIEEQLDRENPHSWVAKQQQEWQENRHELGRLRALLEQWQAKNQVEHEQLSSEAKNAIAQLTEDGQFLNHVREIIRFFKTA
jgi:hypothetical protein